MKPTEELQKFLDAYKGKTFKVEKFVVVNNKRVPVFSIAENSL